MRISISSLSTAPKKLEMGDTAAKANKILAHSDSTEISTEDEVPLSNKIFGATMLSGFSAVPVLGGLMMADSVRANERLGLKDESAGLKLAAAGFNIAGTAALLMGSAPLAVAGLGLAAVTAFTTVLEEFKS